jgi:DNA-binding GntR family transcriptional regulator
MDETSAPRRSTGRIDRSLTNHVYRALKEDILAARLGPEPIVEAVIAEQFRVSKTPVREALHQLAHEGLVVVLPRKGYLVKPMGLGDIVEVMELRRIVEPPLAAVAAGVRTEAQIAEMRAMIEQEDSLSPSLEGLLLSLRLHDLIAAVARNGRAIAVVRALLDESSRIPWLTPGLRVYTDVDEHRGIVDSIEQGDADEASRRMAAHLEAAKARTLAGLGTR